VDGAADKVVNAMVGNNDGSDANQDSANKATVIKDKDGNIVGTTKVKPTDTVAQDIGNAADKFNGKVKDAAEFNKAKIIEGSKFRSVADKQVAANTISTAAKAAGIKLSAEQAGAAAELQAELAASGITLNAE
jgi:hypothetical protein